MATVADRIDPALVVYEADFEELTAEVSRECVGLEAYVEREPESRVIDDGFDTDGDVPPLYHTGGWNLSTLPTLYAGGTVVLPRAFDPGETLSLVEDHGATQLFTVTAIHRALADHLDFASTDRSPLDWAMSGGGPCPESVVEPFRRPGQ